MTAEANAMLARRWFTVGWAGNLDLADDLFAADFRTNGKRVGPTGPKRNVTNRLTGFPDMQSSIEEQIALDDKVVMRVMFRGTHLGLYSGVPPTGKVVEVMALILWRFEEGKVVEDWTVADQFGLLQQLGVLPATRWERKFQLLPVRKMHNARLERSLIVFFPAHARGVLACRLHIAVSACLNSRLNDMEKRGDPEWAACGRDPTIAGCCTPPSAGGLAWRAQSRRGGRGP